MTNKAKFIWISKERYPMLQECGHNIYVWNDRKYKFGVVAFKKCYKYNKNIKTAEIEIFGDTRYYLWQNEVFVGTGPCPAGSDFKTNYQYSSTFKVDVNKPYIDFLVRVQCRPVQETDMSMGKGCLVLGAKLTFDDGTKELVYTDETWLARRENEYISPWVMDYTREKDEWENAVLQENIWNVEPSQIKNLKEEVVSSEKFTVAPKSKEEFKVDLDKIYSAYSYLDIKANGDYKIELISVEKDNISEKKHIIRGNKSESYRSNEYFGLGEYRLIVDNMSDEEMNITSEVIFVCYPSEEKGYFKCSDEMLNRIYELGKWTVKICRQSIELDSPVHQENLMCVGDYIVESMVNNHTTGDYSLTRFDVLRRAKYYVSSEGYAHNENYAYMWFIWLEDYYRYTGDKSIFPEVLEGMETVLSRFRMMENKSGLIEYVGVYGFIDWVFIDGHSMGMPPRVLGETVTNELYYKALTVAADVYEILGNKEKHEYYKTKSEKFKKTFNETFYDKEKGIYFDGLTGVTPVGDGIPENPDNRYYTRYSNTFAVLFDLCDENRKTEIMEWVLRSENLEGVQPYFMHFVFEALTKAGLFEKYGMKLLRRWQVLVEDCEKGMHELWLHYEGYGLDYSHGWGATPTYQLPVKLLGLEILEPGFKKIKLEPCLYGLESAIIEMPTPFGNISCKMQEGKPYELTVPKEIAVENTKGDLR